MRTIVFAMTILPWLHAVPAQAQAMRTFVSGNGKDTNACTITAPCQTLQAALAQTLAGGEINALDSANYGYVTITKAVSIISERGATGVLAPSSVTGITINAGANDVINLRGLDIDGAGAGANGIVFTTGGSLNIRDGTIRGFANHGISFQPTGSSALFVANTIISNNGQTGIMFQNMGSATSIGVFNDVQVVNNGRGIAALGTNNAAPANVTVQGSVVANNRGVGILSGGLSAVTVANSTIANNGVGAQSQGTGATLQLAQSTITGNGTGWSVAGGGQVISSASNSIGGNANGDTAPPTGAPPVPPPPPPSATVDIPPASLLYAGFNNGVVTTSAVNLGSGAVFDSSGKIGQGLSVPSSSLSSSNPVLLSRRGTLAFWVRLNATGDMDSVISEYPGPPYWKVNVTSGSSGQLSIFFAFDGAYAGTGAVQDTLASDTFNFVVGDWHHFVWTWQGTHHRLYRDGALVTDRTMISPMPTTMGANFRIGGGNGSGTATLDELAVYNYAFNLADVAASYSAQVSNPISASGTHGLDLVAQWAPGNGNVLIMADAGSDFATRASSYSVTVVRDGSSVTTGTISNLTSGFGQALIPVTIPLAAGTYTAQVALKDSNGSTLATQTTSSFTVPATSWLGNTLGIAPAGSVQGPWTAISVNETALSVWGRTYTLTGGWGLPQQITSQGANLLAAPVDVDFDMGSGKFNLTPQSLAITSNADDVVTWTGVATGNGIKATINGSLEYDGMMLIRLTLEPLAAPVTIQTMKLQTAMTAARAKYFSWAADTTGQVQAYDPGVPSAPGVVFTNTAASLGGHFYKTRLLPSITLSDDNSGLEWFADNIGGWSVDANINGSTPFQQLVVDSNTNVRLENSFATQPMSLARPVTITFGYEATPIKPLPADWRAMQIGNVGGAPAISGLFSVSWSWPDGAIRGQPTSVWRSYALTPGSYSTIAADTSTVVSRQAILHGNGVYVVPYTQQHTAIAPSVTAPNDTDTVLGFLVQEASNPDGSGTIGYISMPTRGINDYWLSSFDYNLTQGAADGIYIDEPYYANNITAALISGSGFTDSLLINRNGYNSLGVRSYLKRLRQLFVSHGKRPVVWIDASTGYVAPHMWAFADFVSDGEGIGFSDGGPDFVDRYNTTAGLNWLRGISRGEKYGWNQTFLDYVSCCVSAANLNASYRAMTAMLQLFDITPNGHYISQWANYMQPRVSFGITAAGVTFTGYWSNSQIVPNNTAQCSYYKAPNKVLAHCANLSGSAYSGTVTFNAAALGLNGTVAAVDAESGSAIPVANGTFPLSINRHDYRVVKLTGS